MKPQHILYLAATAVLATSACGGRYLGGYEDQPAATGDGDGDGDGDRPIGDGDGDYPIGDGDIPIGDGDYPIGDGDGDYPIGDGDGDFREPIGDPPDPDPTDPAGSCSNPLELTTAGTLGSGGSGLNLFRGPCPGDGDEMVFRFRAPEAGVYVFDTLGSTFDTTLHLTTEPCGGYLIDCNDDYFDLESRVVATLAAGEETYVILQSFDGNVRDYQINVGFTELEEEVCPDEDLGSAMGQPLLVEEVDIGYREFPGTNECGGGPALISYSWEAPYSGTFVFSTAGSSFDTVLTIRDYCGGPMLGCNDDSWDLTSRLSMRLTDGQPVTLDVSAYGDGFDFDDNPDFGGPTVVFSIWEE